MSLSRIVDAVGVLGAVVTLIIVLTWATAPEVQSETLDVAYDVDGTRLGLPEQRRRDLFNMIAKHHDHWTRITKRAFPTHAWSQFDDYHKHHRAHVLYLSRRTGVSYTALLLIYDEGIRRRWHLKGKQPLPATVVPLQPRTK